MILSPSFSSLAAVLTAGLLVGAVPTPETGIRIPLQRRGGQDAVVKKREATLADMGALAAKAVAKIDSALTNYERNTGKAHPYASSPSAVRKAKTEARQAKHEARMAKRGTGSVGLTDQQSGLEWTGPIAVGTPGQTFNMDFDTGSSDTFVQPGYYNPSSSSTAVNTGSPFTVTYGDGSSASGTIYQDTVQVGGLTATGQSVGDATSSSLTGPQDGLVGLAFPSLSAFGDSPLFNTLISEGAVDAQEFGVSLATSGSELYLGGTDSSKYTGAINWLNYDSADGGFWATSEGSVNGIGLGYGIVDTGTTLVIGPPSDVQSLYNSLGVQTTTQDGTVYGLFSPNSIPTITFTFGSTSYTLSPSTASYGTDGSYLVGSVIGESTGLNGWILGDPLIENVYAVFSFSRNQVGFATRA